MPNIGFPELVIVLVVALLVFGPKKLPEMGRSLGKSIREFKQATSGLKDELSLGLEGNSVPPDATPVAPGAMPTTDTAPTVAATAVAAHAVTVTAPPPLPAASEAERAALAAYGIDPEGNPIAAEVATAQTTPPSVFVDANGNEYRLAAAPAAEPAANVAIDAAADQAPDALSDQAII
ncbi:MAG: twin-arginine translocase TatA/TatE family subunit [Thermoleophilia bacterium]